MTLLAADLTGGLTAGLDQLPAALRELRVRMLGLVESIDGDAWRAPSRCEQWTVHDVVRHVRDVSRRLVARLQDDNAAEVPADFDNRVTPQQWLDASAGEDPATTVADLRSLFEAEGPALAGRLAAGTDDQVMGPYGPVHWTVLVAHVLWDGWLHVRDIGGRSSTRVEDGVVALYALLIASVPAQFGGFPLDVSVDLTGSDGHHLLAAVGPGHVTVRVGVPTGAENLRGELGPVADALSGRAPAIDRVLHGDPTVRLPLTWLRLVMAPA